MLNKSLKLILFICMLMLLCAPMIQWHFRVVDLFPLKGVDEEVTDIPFSWQQWFSGEYSDKKDKYITSHFGFRDYLIRLYNQVAYDLWSCTNSKSAIIGKNDYLYELDYIETIYGEDYIGHDRVVFQAHKLKMIQDTLEKLNIALVVVLAPGKGDFFPEYIPDRYHRKKTMTNFEDYRNELYRNKNYFIDFNTWFLEHKDKTQYPLYSKGGVHWSAYGGWLAADSLFRSLEQKSKIDLPEWKCTYIGYPEEERFNDYDAGDALNLLFKNPSYKMAYPFITIEENSSKQRPNLLVIADSYYRLIYVTGIPEKIFSNHTYWYYNRVVTGKDGKLTGLKGVELKKEIEKQKIIILLSNTPNLKKLGWGFIDEAYEVYFGKGNINEAGINGN